MKKSSDQKNKAREHEPARAESSLSKDAAETTLPSRRERQASKNALLRSRGFLRGIETSIERDDDRCSSAPPKLAALSRGLRARSSSARGRSYCDRPRFLQSLTAISLGPR
jgi:hypothetical protein